MSATDRFPEFIKELGIDEDNPPWHPNEDAMWTGILRKAMRYYEIATAPPDRRRIRLAIAPATETHCGLSLDEKCPRLRLREEIMRCEAFGDDFEYNDEQVPVRSKECRMAEVRG